MLILTVDRKSPVPPYRQIRDRVIALVESGDLAPGDRLPATRRLARSAGVHRSTVLRAYGELWSLGYLRSRPGSYSTISRPRRTGAAPHAAGASLIDWEGTARRTGVRTQEQTPWVPPGIARGRDVVDFATFSADPRLAPVDDLRRCLKAVLLERGRELLDYGDPSGHPALKEALLRRMRVHGVEVAADELMITSGAQHALDLVLRLLAKRGDVAVVESPTYAAAVRLFRLHGLELRGVPMLPTGMDLDTLARVLRRRRPALVYTMPTFHNPTGISTSGEHRQRLLRLCESSRVPLVEDGFEEDLKYSGKIALPVKAIDRHGVAIYLGTFSKVVFPGLRIGWIAAPRDCIRRLVAIRRASSLSGVALVQAATARLCNLGLYDACLRRIHASYRGRMQRMLDGLASWMPAGAEWTRPEGGSTLLLTPRGAAADEEALRERLLHAGVRVEPGRPFFPHAPDRPHFRLSISRVDEEEIEEGCRRMGRALA